eukprot:CAMPEP_0119013578 /NCGR_PEP_ID=MMETSP1176-20130426/8527_1 /TAXON_ID=265551 /ORGANISM="Synedropsis recta cf, Strain CCMP1620" /LENGTH=379 /DNA_ID=CAMNT_0006966679 /DNA_START=63 /DNA_END=1202 /DNA_ORIENTATION=-
MSTTAEPKEVEVEVEVEVVEEKQNMVSAKDRETTGPISSFKLMLLALMVMQNSCTVLVGRYTRSSVPKDELFIVNHLVLVTEFAKLILACMLEFNATKGGLLRSIKENIFDRPLDALKIAVPALLYLVQNTLLYVALSNLSAPLFQVTYQAKLVTTAVVSVIMLNRRYSPKQWVCLVLLSIGVAIVVLGEKKDDKKEEDNSDKPEQSLTKGLIAVSIACFCSALAGVYFEKVLKKATTENGTARAPVSLWMRNVQLALFSVMIAVFQGISQGGNGEEVKPFLHGFTSWVWVLVCLQAGGGLLVAAVIKYADNVLKGLATGVSVVAATAASAAFFRVPLTGQFSAGGVCIMIAVYFFSNELPKFLTGGKKNVEMVPMLPK